MDKKNHVELQLIYTSSIQKCQFSCKFNSGWDERFNERINCKMTTTDTYVMCFNVRQLKLNHLAMFSVVVGIRI